MNFKATEIAGFLQGEIVGDGGASVSNVSKIEEAKKGDLAFLANPKYEHYIYNTGASVVLVNKTFVPKQKVNATLIKVENAYAAFATLLDLYMKSQSEQKTGIEQPCFIDETASLGEDVYVGAFAYIGKNVKVGSNVKLYPQIYIGDNVTIGDNCTLFAGVKIYNDTVIGKGCVLHAGAVIGADGFGWARQDDGTYKKIPQIGNVILEDDVDVGANTGIDCGTMGPTTIKKGIKIDNLVQIGHNCEIGENTVISGQTGIAGSTKIGKNCVLAGQVGIAGHLSIGDNCTLAAQTGVISSVKDNETVWLTPAINHREALKASIVFRKLPELRREVVQLRKEIDSLKEK